MQFINMQSMKLMDFVLRGGLVLLGLIYPYIIYHWIGPLPSISEYFMTAAQPIFLLVNAGTSFYFITTKNWRTPGVLLLGLSCFSLEYYESLHTWIAASFFISCLVSILIGKRYRLISIPVLLSALGLFHSIFLAEVLAIFMICTYHFLILKDLYLIYKERSVKNNE